MVGFDVVEVLRLPWIAVPVDSSTMRTNRDFLVEWYHLRDVRGIREVQAAVTWEIKLGKLLQLAENGVETPLLLVYAHGRPFVE